MSQFNPTPFHLQQVDTSGMARGISQGLQGLAQGLAAKRQKEELAAKQLEETKKQEKMMEGLMKAQKNAYVEGRFDPEKFLSDASEVKGMTPQIMGSFMSQGTQANFAANQADQIAAGNEQDIREAERQAAEAQREREVEDREHELNERKINSTIAVNEARVNDLNQPDSPRTSAVPPPDWAKKEIENAKLRDPNGIYYWNGSRVQRDSPQSDPLALLRALSGGGSSGFFQPGDLPPPSGQ